MYEKTLRDEIAIEVMKFVLENEKGETVQNIALLSYVMAEAMMAQRNENNAEPA